MEKFNMKTLQPAKQIAIIIKKIYNDRMTTSSGGNISILDENGDVWFTPTAVDKSSLTEEDICCIKKTGEITGKHKPSSEYPFHLAIYKVRPDIKAIIHAHPAALVSFSIVGQIPDTNITAETKKICGEMGFTPYGLPGSEILGDKIAQEFTESDSLSMIMENHGTVVGGSDLLDTYNRMERCEFCAQTLIDAHKIGIPNYLSSNKTENINANYIPTKADSTNSNYELEEQKQELSDYVVRACKQKLINGSTGVFSFRLSENEFLISPDHLLRWNISAKDIIHVKIDEYLKKPEIPTIISQHIAIYQRHTDIKSVINTQSPYLMSFGIIHKELDLRTIPESWIFVQQIPVLELQASNYEIADVLKDSSPAVLIKNGDFIVTAKSLFQAFDKLEIAEFTAQSVISSSSLGKIKPLNNFDIEDLRKKFLT